MTLMEQEIFSQPQMLKACKDYNESIIAKVAEEVKNRKIHNIVTAARGSSDNASNYFKYICETVAGIPVSSAAPSVITLYGGKLSFANTLVIGVSQSGKAADVLAVMERAKGTGGLTVSVTNNLESPMAKAADFHIFLNVGEEKSVAATKTFTAQMYSLALLAAKIAGDKELDEMLSGVPALVTETLKCKESINKSAVRLKNADDCYVLARGMNYPAAQEAALKIQETTYIKAKCYAVSDFHHGPFAVIDNRTHAIVFAPGGQSKKDADEMIDKIKSADCGVTVFSDEKYEKADSFIVLPPADDYVSPFIYVVAAQMFALSLSTARGLNPDSPRGLKKVTITK